jgi:choline kinase
MRRLPIRQTVILAAGNGSRLSAARGGLPKPLLKVAGRPLIDYALDQAAEAGCEQAVVVTGNGADLLAAHLKRVDTPLSVKLVYNPRYHDPNGVSLLCAEPEIDGPFFLQMADHVFGRPVLARLAESEAAPGRCARLLVDFHPVGLDEADATKVTVREGLISSIGKDLRKYDAVDTGCFLLDPRIFAALRDVAQSEPPSVTLGMRRLIARNELAAVALKGVRWTDVDTPEDYGRAELLLSARRRAGPEAVVTA